MDGNTMQYFKENCQQYCQLRNSNGMCIFNIPCTQVNLSLCMTLRNAYFKGFYDCHELTKKDIKEGKQL